MKKKDEKEIVNVIGRIAESLRGAVDNQKNFSYLFDRIVGLIEFLMRSVSVIFFILTLLVWRVFLWEPFSNLLDGLGGKWSLLSERYQMLILGVLGAIIAGIIAHVAGAIILEKIKKISKK